MYLHALNNLQALVDLEVIKGRAMRYNIQLNEVRSENGETLIGAFMNRLQFIDQYNVNHKTIVRKLLDAGIQPTDADMMVVNGLRFVFSDPHKKDTQIVREIIDMVRNAHASYSAPAGAQ